MYTIMYNTIIYNITTHTKKRERERERERERAMQI
jgi:hypothetical protein